MPYKIPRNKSSCKGCPLDGAVNSKCFGTSDTEKPEIILLGEAPGEEEDLQGIPFIGYCGRFLKSAVDDVGHLWHKAHKTNVIICRPPSNSITCPEAIDAIVRCKLGLLEELRALHARGVRVIVAVGATAMNALNIPGTITKSRGSVYMLKLHETNISVTEDPSYDFICVPTFHPSFLLRGNLQHETTFVNDIDKAYSFVGKKYVPPKENFSIFPTIQKIEDRTERIISAKTLIAVDCETTSLVPSKSRIIVVGVATSGTDAFSVPFAKQGGSDYWSTSGERIRAHRCLQRLMAEVPTMFQNSMFDMRHLLHFNAPVLKLAEDTMILSHTISPELPHNIGYIVSIYGKTPYWKDEVLQASDRMINLDDELLRTYNLRDCVTLFQVIGPMLKEAKENKTLHIYRNISMPLVYPVMHMTEKGMLLDKKALRKWELSLKGKLFRAEKNLREITNVPETFNFNSGDHMRYLLFGIVPGQATKARKEYEEYEKNPKKNKNTKTYKELTERVALFENIVPFPKLKHALKKTESGSVSVDEDALLNVQIAASNRLAEIAKLRTLTDKHEEERATLKRIVSFLDYYRKYAEYEKLVTTYTSFPVDKDGRVKFPYRITGTATGRMSSGSKKSGEPGNAQNIPKEARVVFIAPEGKVLIQGDYSNLELRVLAEVSNDTVLQKTFAQGLKVHDENVKLLFGLEKNDPMWDAAKRACKTYIFGRNYGGGLMGIYRKVAKAVPELGLTYERFCQIDGEYRRAHPKYQTWYDATVKVVSADRCLKNAFGRIRYFLGSNKEILREGLNFPIQSTGADALNMAIIRISKANLKAELIASVHDSLVFEVSEKLAKREALLIKKLMEVPVTINGKDISFPVDMEMGPNWGSMQKIEF